MRDSKVRLTRINTTEASRVYTEAEINDLLIADLRNRAGLNRGPVKGTVIFTMSDSISGGPRREANVRVILDHEPVGAVEEAL